MSLRNKILIILGFCVIVSIGSFLIISMMFDNFEKQLFEKCRIETLTGSTVMSEFLEFFIKIGVLKEADIFDTNYQPVPGTKPVKYHTRYDAVFDTYIQKIEDKYLSDQDVDFAILIDRNGYVPTHNTKYSRPATGDVRKDLHWSRSKRNFSASPEIRQALKSTQEVVKLLYFRDTGEALWIIGSPVFVKGQHWGSFLIGVTLDRIDELKNQMIIIISAVMFIVLSLTILALIAVIPRKMFHTDINLQRHYD